MTLRADAIPLGRRGGVEYITVGFVGCLLAQRPSYHTEIEVADQTFHLTPSQYTDTGPTSPSADPITTGTLQGSP